MLTVIKLSFNIVVPSYKRAEIINSSFIRILCDKVKCQVVVPKEQEADYKKNLNPKIELVIIPDEYEGRLLRKRNWILANLFTEDFLMMADDDVTGVEMITDLSTEYLTPEEMIDLFENCYELCQFYNVNFFGFAQMNMTANLMSKKTTISNNFISEVLCGYTNKSIRYNEDYIFRGDVDLYFKMLLKDDGVMRFNLFTVKMLTRHGFGSGGLRSNIDKNAVDHDNELLLSLYGLEAKKLINALDSQGKGVYHE